jgi:uncharacterized protein (TIGR00269 family)
MSSEMQSTHCRKCGRPAVIQRPYSGEVLCEQCFQLSIVEAVREAISKWNMLQRTDRIAVAYSGGKDSTVLLSILVEIQQKFPDSEVFAVTLDEGVAANRERISVLAETTRRLGVEHVVSSYQDLFSLNMDEIAQRVHAKPSGLSSCAYCGTLRRQGLNIVARQAGADKLALGHNLDDEVQSMLMNILSGDLQRLARNTPVQEGVAHWLVPRIKPLYHIPEHEISLYASYLDLPVHRARCPYAEESLRTEIREWLDTFDSRHPGSKFNLAATLGKIVSGLPNQPPELIRKCRNCGEPTSTEFCGACTCRDELGFPKGSSQVRSRR